MECTDGIELSRAKHLVERVVIVDGLFGCGKTMLSPIVGALDRVELLTYAYEVEYICALYALNKITHDAAVVMVRMLTDLQLYNAMMSRETNFRPSDLSSVFRSGHSLRYLRRLFQQGDEATAERIRTEKPILHLATHNLLGLAEPVVAALESRLVFIEVVRHPLYMIKQQTINMERLHGDVRDFTIYFRWGEHELPFFARGWEEQYLASCPAERAIYYSERATKRTEETKECMRTQHDAKILTVPFERFVLNPVPQLQQIAEALALGRSITCATRNMMRKQHVPRKKYAEGIALRIYKRCGWEPAEKNTTEKEEFQKRRQFAIEKGASPEALRILDNLSAAYEARYLKDIEL